MYQVTTEPAFSAPQSSDAVPAPSVPYAISIEPQHYGYLVRCGCKSFVFEDKERMVAKISQYYADPSGVQKAFMDGVFDLKS